MRDTLVIVVVQLPVAKWLEGRRRMAAYGVALAVERVVPPALRRTPVAVPV